MEESNSMKRRSFNTKQVHRLNFIVTCIVVFLIVTPIVIDKGVSETIMYIIAGLTVIALSLLNFIIKFPYTFKAVLFSVIPGAVIYSLYYLDGFTLNKHHYLFITIVMAAIYFDKKILLIYGLIIDIFLITAYAFVPDSLLGESNTFSNFIVIFFVINGILYMLSRLNQWGGQLVTDAQKNEQEAIKLLQEAKELVQKIEQSAHTLGEETDDVKNISNSLEHISNTILSSAQQIAQAIQSEADSIVTMHDVMQDSKQELSQTVELSQEAMQLSQNVNEQLRENAQHVDQVTKHMDELGDSMNTTVHTMDELQKSLQTVNELLISIKNIADQTNLLALNAAIEAARAGENGKGFAVVAEEVRKLAEESAQTASKITEVTLDLSSKSSAAQEQSLRGQTTALEGRKLLKEIALVFRNVKHSSDISNANMEKSVLAIEKISKQFNQILSEIEMISAMSQQNSAATEEIVSSINEEHNLLASIGKATAELQQLNRELIALTK